MSRCSSKCPQDASRQSMCLKPEQLRFALSPGDEETVVSVCPVLHVGFGPQIAWLHRAYEKSRLLGHLLPPHLCNRRTSATAKACLAEMLGSAEFGNWLEAQ